MIQFNPSIRVHSLKLFSQGEEIYHGDFHLGVNIIRSETNSCGKSTIMDFIYFLLGGEVTEWTGAAKNVDFGMLDVEFSGSRVTIKRERGAGEPASYIFEGPMVDAIKTQAGWSQFGHRRSESTKSYSQIIFELLGFPEQKVGLEANVTLNQILRLIYCDQSTSVNKIYKDIGNFDREVMRKSIVELLLAIDDFQLLEKRLELLSKQSNLSEINGEIKSLSDTLRQIYSMEDFRADWVDLQVEKLENKIEELQGEIEKIVDGNAEEKKKKKSVEVKTIEDTLFKVKNTLGEFREALSAIIFEIEDSIKFLDSLTERRSAIDTAIAVKEVIGSLDFLFCPVCLTTIDPQMEASQCTLCKTEINPSSKHFNRIRARNEIDFQIRESTDLLKRKKESKSILEADISKMEAEEKKLIRDYESFKLLPNYVDSEIRSKMVQIGYIERNIEDLFNNKKLGNLLEDKRKSKDSLSAEISRLTDEITLLEKDRGSRWAAYRSSLEKSVISILKRDTGVQDDFQDAKNVEIHFDKDNILVDGNSKFSASSDVILKNALFLSILKLSCENKEVRFPRFLMLDNIEDKGMTPDRSINFQKIIHATSLGLEANHQIIFTTSMIAPELDNANICVGPKYSPTNRSLKFTLPTV